MSGLAQQTQIAAQAIAHQLRPVVDKDSGQWFETGFDASQQLVKVLQVIFYEKTDNLIFIEDVLSI